MTDQPCLFVPPHEPFYCRIHADVRLSLNDERCGKARLVASRGEPADTLRDILGRMHVGPLHPADRSWLTEHGLHALDDIIGAFTQLAAAHRECRSPSTGDAATHRPEWLDDVPTGRCECGKAWPHA
jgi:hypothetical protein